jgi:hypothetical protein
VPSRAPPTEFTSRAPEVGSVGVVAVHVDESGADAKAGLARTFVFAGERKVDANAHEPLSETLLGVFHAHENEQGTKRQDDLNALSHLSCSCPGSPTERFIL